MTLTFDWFLPTSGDGRTIYGRGHSLPIAQAQAADRPPDLEYLGQVARAAEQLGRPSSSPVWPLTWPAPGGCCISTRS